MATFNGTLNSNEIFAALYNMIISQQVFADPIANSAMKLVNEARVDGSLYGDTKLYYSTDVLSSFAWLNDAEAQNLLRLHRPPAPKVQKITLNVFRMIALTVDNYLSKRAWSTEGAFSDFNAVMLSWMGKTKDIYDATTYNAAVGTMESPEATQNITITLQDLNGLSGTELEAANRHNAQYIATKVGDILIQLEDITRDYNDNKFLRSYDRNKMKFIWNAEKVNEITKYDLPTIFHKEGLIDKFGEYALPARYFGTRNTQGGTAPTPNTSIRSLYEADFGDAHVFAGDLLPSGTVYDANTTYTQDDSILFKVTYDGAIPYMSAFNVGTEFYNPRSLTSTHYTIWGTNTIDYLHEFPMMTVKSVRA